MLVGRHAHGCGLSLSRWRSAVGEISGGHRPRVLHWHTLRDQRHRGPDDHRIVSAGVEIKGVFRSLDGGDTWTHLETGLYDLDIHAVTIAATQPKRLLPAPHAKCLPAAIWAKPGSPWASRRNGRCPMPAALWSRPIPACCSPGVARPRRVKKGARAPHHKLRGDLGDPATPHPAQCHCVRPCHTSR
jgi:hypothetical protein